MAESRMEEFVGAGWAFPLGVTASGGVALARGAAELEQAMRLILATYPGERRMRPEFGSRLRDFVFRGANAQTVVDISLEVRQALLRWEPRVDVVDVTVSVEPTERNLLYVDIRYVVKTTNDPRNLVFPFYTIPEDGSDY